MMVDNTHNRLYKDLSKYWSAISPIEDYAAEAELIYELLNFGFGDSPLSEGPWSVLELGCGSGHMLHHLGKYSHVSGLDREADMLAICRKNNPDMPVHEACMTDFKLDEQFDAIVAYDAIDYLLEIGDIEKTFKCAMDHLKPGGLLLFAPTYTQETFEPAATEPYPVIWEDRQIMAQTSVDLDNQNKNRINLTINLEFPDSNEVMIQDLHPCGLFSRDAWTKVFSIAVLSDGLTMVDMSGFYESHEIEAGDLPFQPFIGLRN